MKKRWIGRGAVDLEKVNELSAKYNISPELAAIIQLRDIDYDSFINPGRTVYDSHLFKDMDKGVGIIRDAIEKGQVICAVNDYDVDGDTSGTIMKEGIGVCGGKVFIITPKRKVDGYGISRRIIDEAKKRGAEVIVTTDNGIAATDSIAYAKSLGFTVVVTDHHRVPKDENGNDILPEADAIIDPMQSDCQYPFKRICGAEVAFKFIILLFQSCNIPMETAGRWFRRFTELAAIGTVCDVMPLVAENRALVKAGLELLKSSQVMGIRQLMKAKNMTPEKVSVYNINYGIGPCMNAMSRLLDDTDTVLDFLSERDYVKADKLAAKLNSVNEERKALQEEIMEQAKQILELEGENQVNILYIPNANSSILGIVAGKLRELTGHPTVCLTKGADGNLTGSGRSTENYGMFEMFSKHKELFTKFGGHSGAIGISIPEDNLVEVIKRINKDAADYDFAVTTVIDLAIPMENITDRFVSDIQTLEPFGEGNDAPVLCDCTSTLTKLSRMGSEGQYLSLYFKGQNGKSYRAKYFGNADSFDEYIRVNKGADVLKSLYDNNGNPIELDVIFTPEFDYWNGVRNISYKIEDYRMRG